MVAFQNDPNVKEDADRGQTETGSRIWWPGSRKRPWRSRTGLGVLCCQLNFGDHKEKKEERKKSLKVSDLCRGLPPTTTRLRTRTSKMIWELSCRNKSDISWCLTMVYFCLLVAQVRLQILFSLSFSTDVLHPVSATMSLVQSEWKVAL